MVRVFIILFLVFSISISSGIASVSSIPFQLSNGLMLIKAKVDDHQEGLFIFDTGSSDILINGKPNANKKDILESVNGSLESQQIYLQSLELGSIKKKGIQAFLTDLSGIEAYIQKELMGIISGDYFSPNEVFIDLKNKTIEISPAFDFKEYSKKHRYSLSEEENITLVQVPFNGKILKLGLDSGASSHILSSEALKEHGIRYDLIETIDLINHQGKKDPALRVETEPLLSSDPSENSFLIKDLSKFNELTGVELDGFVSITAINADFVYLNKKKMEVIIGNY